MSNNKCSLCKYELYNPLKLNCGHIFCYICSYVNDIKKTKYCPICKTQMLSYDFLPCDYNKKSSFNFVSQSHPLWAYEGRNYGWWLYSFANNDDLEILYQDYIDSSVNEIQNKLTSITYDDNASPTVKQTKQYYKITVFNEEYIVNFETMKQTPTKYMDRLRNIKRITDKDIFGKLYIKGISGYSFI